MTNPPRHTAPHRGLTFTFAVGLAVLLAAAAPAHADRALPAAKTFEPYQGLERSLRGGTGFARVLVHVQARSTAGEAAGAPAGTRRTLAGQPTQAELGELATASPTERGEVAAGIEQRRHQALDRLQPAVDETTAAQSSVIRAVKAAGGHVLEHDTLTGAITASIPRAVLPILTRRRDVVAITSAPVDKPLYLNESTAAVGAPSLWAAGFLGGRGFNDTTGPDLALIGDRIYQHHPAFAGISFQTPAWATGLCSPTIIECAHGTQVAGMAFSQGVTGTSTPSDADQKGVAHGVDTVLDADLDYWTSGAWLLGLDQSGGDGLHGTQPGAADPAEIVNASYGSRAGEDDSAGARGYDNLATGFGVTSAIGAGNEGPTTGTVSSPCIAYDSICAGAFKIWAPGDWRIPDFSSRGPTVGGRKKPDLVAVGSSGTANANWTNDGRLWTGVEGTSFAAPQVAAAATLLAGSGVTHHLAHKSVLINSARQGRKTPAEAMGTQTDWQPDWGWGALDLTGALGQRSAVVPSTATVSGIPGNHTVAEIAEGDVHFYEAATQAAGDRATLVWDRRAVACIHIGCPEGSYGMILTDLGLSETSADGSTVRDERPSTVDNVEQVRSPGAASVIYKVRALSTVDGAALEPYSLAARRPIKRLATPRPKVMVTSDRTETKPGEEMTITATIANPSPDLAAGSVTATLELPSGGQVVSGSTARPIGSLAANATSSQTWSVRFTGEGSQSVRVAVAATALSESLPAAAGTAVLVDGTASAPSISAPAGNRIDMNLPVFWGGSDSGVGVASYDIEAAINGGPFTSWLTSTPQTAATYAGQTGSSYQFRARARDRLGNLSDWSTSPLTSIVTPPPTATGTPQPGPDTPIKVTSRLRISKARMSTGRLTTSGRLTGHVRGRVTVSFSARADGRPRSAKVSRPVLRGAWSAALRLTGSLRKVRTGKLTVSYRGDALHAPATTSRSIRRSRS